MAERQKRRRFTAEFKAEAVKRLLDGGKGLGEVATELGLSPGQLSAWRNEHLAAGSAEALAARKMRPAARDRLPARRPHLRGRPLPAAPELGCRLPHPQGGGPPTGGRSGPHPRGPRACSRSTSSASSTWP